MSVVALLVVLVAAAGVAGTMQRSSAEDAAQEHREAVLEHLEAVRAGPEAPDRVAAVQDRVELASVRGGARLSGDYRDARALQRRYERLLDDSTPFFREALLIEVEVPKLSDGLQDAIGGSIDAQSLQGEQLVEARRAEAQDYTDLADALDAQYFSADYRAEQQEAVTSLRGMATVAEELADLAEQDGPREDVTAAGQRLGESYQVVRDFYAGAFVEYAQELADRLPAEAEETDAAYAAMIEDLGGDPEVG